MAVWNLKAQSDARNFPRIFSRARGTELWDVHGGRYLDFLAGAGSLNYGHNDPDFEDALVAYFPRRDHPQPGPVLRGQGEFLESMHDISGAARPRLRLQFTGPTGTNAVEAALKLARKVTGRPNVIAFTNAFHGVSLGALAVTGNDHHRRAAGVPLHGATPMPFDGYFGLDVDARLLERMLTDPSSGVDAPAAIMLETVQGEGGLNVASAALAAAHGGRVAARAASC